MSKPSFQGPSGLNREAEDQVELPRGPLNISPPSKRRSAKRRKESAPAAMPAADVKHYTRVIRLTALLEEDLKKGVSVRSERLRGLCKGGVPQP